MRLDSRKWRQILHSISIVIAIAGSIYGWIILEKMKPTIPGRLNMTEPYEKILMHLIYMNISALLSTTLLITGGLSPSLHEKSSAVVHSSLMLCFLHMGGYSLSIAYKEDKEEDYSSAVVSASLNMLLLLLWSLQLVLNSYNLRSNAWPHGKTMQIFTIETLLVGVRMGMAIPCIFSTRYSFSASNIPYAYTLSFGAMYNILTTAEAIMSLYWGVPHHKLTGVNGFISAIMLSISLAALHVPKSDLSVWQQLRTNPSIPEAILLAAGHSFCSIVIPDTISTVPALFLQFTQVGEPETNEHVHSGTRTLARGSGEVGVSSPSSQYQRFFGSASLSLLTDATEQSTNRLNLMQLVKTGWFMRNLILCAASAYVVWLGSYVALGRGHYRMGGVIWSGSILQVCFGSCLCLRTLPTLLVALKTRLPVVDPPSRHIAAAVSIESILAITGALISFFSTGYLLAAGIISLLITVLQFLHIGSIVRSQKLLAAASF